MKFKIGVLTEIINSHSGARAPLEIAKHLSLLGHSVTVYGYDLHADFETKKELEKCGVHIVTIPYPNGGYIQKFTSIIPLYTVLKKTAPEILTFSGTPPFFIAGKLTGIPIIRIYQGIQFDAFLERKNPHERVTFIETIINHLCNLPIFLIDLLSFRLSTKVVAISNYAQIEGERLFHRLVDAVIYHGTTPLLATKNQLAKKANTIYLLSVSRLTPYKGFHTILSALKKVKSKYTIITSIAGSQPKKKYVSYLKKLGGRNLRLILDPTDEKLAQLYQQSDIYVSADRLLYFGMPITEAAQYGKPTIVMNFAAAPEIVVHTKTGLVAKTETQFISFIEKLVHDKNVRLAYGKNAKKKADEFFTWQRTAQKYQKFISDTLRKGKTL